MGYRGVWIRATGPVLDDSLMPLEGGPCVDVFIGLGTDGDPITDTESLMTSTYQLDGMAAADGDAPLLVPGHSADDAQGMLYIWMCPKCGQPLPEGARCNSGVHQGPDTIGTEGTENDTRPHAVRSIDLVRPTRGDEMELWLKRMRDKRSANGVAYNTIDQLLDRYRECSDYGLSLRPVDDERGDP